jgi:acetyltransferase-like isoleucine patch superfamily enzyme
MKRLEDLLRVTREELSWDPRKVAVRALSSGFPQHGFNRVRTRLLMGAGVHIGPGAAIGGPLRITGPGVIGKLLSIGAGSYISGNMHIDLGARVRIGARVYIGDDVKLLTGTHELGPAEQRCDRLRWAGVEIGDGTWIGSRVTIMPGVKVGHGAVIGAGAVVTSNLASDAVFGGVPAKLIRGLDAHEVASLVPSSGVQAGSQPRLRISERHATGWSQESDDEVRAAMGFDRALYSSSP